MRSEHQSLVEDRSHEAVKRTWLGNRASKAAAVKMTGHRVRYRGSVDCTKASASTSGSSFERPGCLADCSRRADGHQSEPAEPSHGDGRMLTLEGEGLGIV